MKNSFYLIIKTVNGLYSIAFLFWLLYIYTYTKTNTKGYVLLSLFLSVTEVIFFLYSVVFYFMTKNIFTSKQQKIYSIVISMLLSDVFLLIISLDLIHNTYTVLVLIFNLIGIIYLKIPQTGPSRNKFNG